ncbi:MAG TPA: hypothetical protein VIS96_02730 [Terrimicrobiaceae bacterium]
MNIRVLLIFLLIPGLRAELPPSAYESMQAKAPEYLKIEVLRVDVEPGESPTRQNIHVVALTTDVFRTASGLKPNEIVNIIYTVTSHPQGWAGPGEVPIPNEKERSVAYLVKTEGGDFAPAAGRMSFTNF